MRLNFLGDYLVYFHHFFQIFCYFCSGIFMSFQLVHVCAHMYTYIHKSNQLLTLTMLHLKSSNKNNPNFSQKKIIRNFPHFLFSSHFLIQTKCVKSVYLFGFYGISTFVGYLMSNPFLYKWTVLFQTIQLSISTQFNCQKHFYFKLFSFVKQFSLV